MKTTIIQAREASSISSANGNYSSILKKPIKIMEGDEVVLETAFIDTRQHTGDRIEIDEDLVLEFDTIQYFINSQPRFCQYFGGIQGSGSPGVGASVLNDGYCAYMGKFCVNSNWTNPNLVPGVTLFNPLKVSSLVFTPNGVGQEINIQLAYRGLNGEKQFLVVKLPKTSNSYRYTPPAIQPEENQELVPQCFVIRSDFEILEPTRLTINSWTLSVDYSDNQAFQPIEAGGTNGFYSVEPATINYKMIVPKGTYTPEHLASYITRIMNRVYQTGDRPYIEANDPQNTVITPPNMPNKIAKSKDLFSAGVPNTKYSYMLDDGVWVEYDCSGYRGLPFLCNENQIQQRKSFGGVQWIQSTVPGSPAFQHARPDTGYFPKQDDFVWSSIGNQYRVRRDKSGALHQLGQYFKFCGWAASAEATSNQLCGASQMSLEYNDGFRWSYAHTPLYQDGNIVGTLSDTYQFTKDADGFAIQSFFYTTEQAGVAFSSLRPSSFWEDTLGFDLSKMCVNFTMQSFGSYSGKIISGMPNTSTVAVEGMAALATGISIQVLGLDQAPYYFQKGLNRTGGVLGSGALANTSTEDGVETPSAAFVGTDTQVKRFLLNPSTGVFAIGTATVPIVAQQSLLHATNEGYYLIEINGKIANSFTGSSFNSNLISAIVNKYYTQGNYTSASDGIPYVHVGEPIYLTELGVRILNPDGSEARSVGNDNTIFLKIVSQTPPAPVDDKKKK